MILRTKLSRPTAWSRRTIHLPFSRVPSRFSKRILRRRKTLSYEYWPAGELKKKQLADGTWTGQYTYDLAGQLKPVANASVASATEPSWFVADMLYNAKGQVTGVSYGNGVSTAYTYNAARGFLSRILSTQGAVTAMDLTYAHNNKGMITGVTSPDATRTASYSYDGL